MGKTKFARVSSRASLAAMLMGSVVWSGAARAQNTATTNATVGAATAGTTTVGTGAATAGAGAVDALSQTQNRNGSVASSRAPVDPGVRGGAAGAGGPLTGLNDVERQYFEV